MTVNSINHIRVITRNDPYMNVDRQVIVISYKRRVQVLVTPRLPAEKKGRDKNFYQASAEIKVRVTPLFLARQ